MFNRSFSGPLGFGSASTSTPTSTPAPTMNNQFPRENTSLFGNINSNNNNNNNNSNTLTTSAATPSTNLFGNKTTQTGQTGTGLFGNATKTTNSMFGGSSTTASQAGPSTTPSLKTGLFGNTNTGTSTANPSGGLFGNKPLFSSGTTTSGPSLFGGSNTGSTGAGTGTFSFGNAGSSGGLTGTTTGSLGLSSNKPLLGTTGTSSGLFGNKSTTLGTTGTSSGTGLFGNKPLFSSGTTSTYTAPTTTGGSGGSGSLFGNQNTSLQTNFLQNVPPANPYGLKVGNLGTPLSNMPSSITGEPHNRSKPEEGTERDIGTLSDTKRSHSISLGSSTSPSGTLSPAPKKLPPPSLFSKLSSRLSAITESSTEGVFSPSNSIAWLDNAYKRKRGSGDKPSRVAFGRVTASSGRDSPLDLARERDVSSLLRLKIDPTRIASKKLKLLSGNSVATKESSNTEVKRQAAQPLKHILVNSTSGGPIADTELENRGESSPEVNDHPELDKETSSAKESGTEPDAKTVINLSNNGYWCSPSIEQLLNMPVKQLASVPDFAIGRKGYGTITFNYDVDLTGLADDLENNLFGKVVIFNPTKTVEVYPDPETKPPVGQGLNVPSTITIENVYPIDKRTKKVIKDVSNSSETQKLVKKLKNMGGGMEFISYNPYGGIWTFRVKHFSIWGLVDEKDAEISEGESESDEDMSEGTNSDEQINGAQFSVQQQGGHQQALVKASNGTGYNEIVVTGAELLSNDANEIIAEKQYEPQIDEADFDVLEVEVPLDTSPDWVEQLKLAGTSIRSVYTQQKQTDERINADNMHLLFSRFNRDYELLEKVKKGMRLSSSNNFAKFTPTSSILFKKPFETSGIRIGHINSKLSKNDLIMKDSEVSKHLQTLDIEPRAHNGFPHVRSGSWKFENILSHISSTDTHYNIWELCSILFDPIELPYDIKNQTTREILMKQQKFDILCAWVVKQITPEVQAKISQTTNPLDTIFYHILLNDPLSACKVATASRNAHLAPLLTFLGSNDPRFCDMARQQLLSWKESGHQVDSRIQRIYHVLGGTFFESGLYLNRMLNEFSWMTVFGLGLFYSMIDENTLEAVVSSLLAMVGVQENDLAYSVLQIYGHQKLTDNFFANGGISTQNTDIQFQWYFTQVLRFNGILDISDIQSDKITLQFMEELLFSNHITQALMVACFLADDKTAKAQISTIVSHNIALLYEQNLQFLLDLKIPETFIYVSLAQYNRYCGDHLAELEHLLKAKLYNEAEKVALVNVGPDLILAHNYTKNIRDLFALRDILNQFPKLQMASWDQGLGVYEEYLEFVVDSVNSDKLKDSIEKGSKLLLENHKHCKSVSACCYLIQKRIKSIMM